MYRQTALVSALCILAGCGRSEPQKIEVTINGLPMASAKIDTDAAIAAYETAVKVPGADPLDLAVKAEEISNGFNADGDTASRDKWRAVANAHGAEWKATDAASPAEDVDWGLDMDIEVSEETAAKATQQ